MPTINDILGGGGPLMGDQMGLVINGSPVSCETSCYFTFNQETKPVSPVDAGRWRDYIPGVRSWQMGVSANFLATFSEADFKTVLQAVLTGESMQVAMRTQINITNQPYVIISGLAIPSTGTLTAGVSDTTGYSIVFEGKGAFAVDFEAEDGDFWRILNAMPANADKPYYIQSDL